jgi:hypothetical protein
VRAVRAVRMCSIATFIQLYQRLLVMRMDGVPAVATAMAVCACAAALILPLPHCGHRL